MTSQVKCDVLVVGAGPAGSRAAAAAVRQGAKTFLIEAKTCIGEKPHCGEFVPRQLFTELGLEKSCIIQPVEKMQTQIIDLSESPRCSSSSLQEIGESLAPSGSCSAVGLNEWQEPTCDRSETPSPGFLIDRPRFDRDLAREAAALGATVLSSARLVQRQDDAWIVRHGRGQLSFRPRCVVAADGALSRVAGMLGMKHPGVLRGVQAEVPLTQPLDSTFVFLSRELVGGYGWLFPKGIVANVGLGVIPRHDVSPKNLLEKLLDRLMRLGMIRAGALAWSGGLIPISGIRDRLIRDDVVFCGDAAGLTHPITGAGIPQAVISGELAGRAAGLASTTGDRKTLTEYEHDIKGRYRGVLAHASAKRRLMMSLWDDPNFPLTCEQVWIGFKGYRKRVKDQGPIYDSGNGKIST